MMGVDVNRLHKYFANEESHEFLFRMNGLVQSCPSTLVPCLYPVVSGSALLCLRIGQDAGSARGDSTV